jgi:hypothetical protein
MLVIVCEIHEHDMHMMYMTYNNMYMWPRIAALTGTQFCPQCQ